MKQPAILMYHWFRDAGTPSTSRSPQLEITPERFAEQMAFLARRGYRSATLSDALAAAGEGTASSKTVVLTFDDGTADFWTHARPTLAEHGFRATLFAVTGYVGGASEWDRHLGEPARPLLDWDQIVELHREGHEIGSHTHMHRVLTELSDDQARDELERSRERLAERIGEPPAALAYPRGFYGQRHKQLAREAGYDSAAAVILRWRDMRRSDRYELKRMTVKGTESMLWFRLRLGLARRVRWRPLDGGAPGA